MTAVLNAVAAILLFTLLVALVRIWRGPDPADRMLASQLFGTTGVGFLLVLSEALEAPALVDVALTLALLSVLALVAFVTRVAPSVSGDGRSGANEEDRNA
ncbi:monovalent cation/H+ antiporter complex subunit F [Marinobacter daepoensis]|uniref:monovalent cation/H+ antiporter complex subunit F n=1 Tax=Marinobacter daepoensis TaxID=262077 RepID=UPI00040C4C5D|nr:monovalent cation/H+ antiporter complex subunit F [Marinobacter daepoensis]